MNFDTDNTLMDRIHNQLDIVDNMGTNFDKNLGLYYSEAYIFRPIHKLRDNFGKLTHMHPYNLW